MYGLVQAGVIAHDALKENIDPYGCAPAKITQGLWAHKYRDIHFTIMVDDLGIRYRNKKYTDHLISALQSKYEVTQYWTWLIYFGIKLKWDYKARKLYISIPG